MKFSLKVFVGVAILLGVIAGLISRKIRVSQPLSVPMSYDVINAKKRIEDNYPAPTEMILWRDPAIYRRLRKQAVAEFPPTEKELLESFIDDPSTYVSYKEEHQDVVRKNRQTILSETQHWLSDPCPSLVNVALMRALHNDRKGFDALKRQRIEKPENGPISLLGKFPVEWWRDDQEFRDAMHQMLKTEEVRKESIVYALKSVGETQPWIDHYFSVAEAAEPYGRLNAIKSLTEEELSQPAFELLELELADDSAKHQKFELAEVLARFFETDDQQLRSKAFAVCKRMALRGDENTHERNAFFHRQLCEHGGEEHIDYFIRFAKEHRCEFAMKALGRLWPRDKAVKFAKEHKFDAVVAELLKRDALPYLRQRLRDEPGVHLSRLAVKAAGGQTDPETVAVIESLLPDVENFSYDPPYIEGRKLLRVMQQLGCDNIDEMRSKLPEPDPQMLATRASYHWIAHDIDQQDLIDFLNASKISTAITRDDVYQQIEANGRPVEEFEHNDLFKVGKWMEGYSAREFTFNALETAGVAHECHQLEPVSAYLSELLEMINRTSVGFASPSSKSAAKDHRIWLAPEGAPPKVHVTFGHRTFELSVFEDQSHPILVAEALNTMLDQFTEYDHRFYAYIFYPDGYDEHYVAYLKPEIAKKLEDEFGLIPFPPY